MITKLISILVPFALSLPTLALSAERTLVEDGSHLFILSGQSNMREPLPSAFAESVARVFGKDKVIVVTAARPSQPINQWYRQWAPPERTDAPAVKNIGSMYDILMNAVNRQIEGKELASVTFVWMQGEADAESGWGAVYEKSFHGVLDQLKADIGVKSVNFVLGRINDYWLTDKGIVDGDLVRRVQMKLGDENANGDWVDTDDLNSGLNPWGIFEIDGGHFPNSAYRVLGQRFAGKACQLVDPDVVLVDTFFDAEFIDSSDDVESHAAIGKAIKATAPDAAAPGLAVLLDGKFGSPDAKEKAWLGFAPAEGKVGFDVDLGETRSVTAVGIDILFNPEAGAALPGIVHISTSADGTNYLPAVRKPISFFYGRKQLDAWSKDAKPQALLVLAELEKTDARFVRIEVEKVSPGLFVDEIVVNPVAK